MYGETDILNLNIVINGKSLICSYQMQCNGYSCVMGVTILL